MIHRPRPSTFSIVAHDPQAGEWGVAVESKFLCVGAMVSWARAGAGAVATQSYCNTSFGPEGLALMEQGASAQEAVDRLIAGDEWRAHRQVGMVDARGQGATFTGQECHAWAGGFTGSYYTATRQALSELVGTENFEERYDEPGGQISSQVMDIFREKFAPKTSVP